MEYKRAVIRAGASEDEEHGNDRQQSEQTAILQYEQDGDARRPRQPRRCA